MLRRRPLQVFFESSVLFIIGSENFNLVVCALPTRHRWLTSTWSLGGFATSVSTTSRKVSVVESWYCEEKTKTWYQHNFPARVWGQSRSDLSLQIFTDFRNSQNQMNHEPRINYVLHFERKWINVACINVYVRYWNRDKLEIQFEQIFCFFQIIVSTSVGIFSD